MGNPGTPQEISTPRRENSRSLQPNGHVDLKALNVGRDIKLLIQHGDTVGDCPSPSGALTDVLSALVSAGCDDELIARLCLLEDHGISSLPRAKGPAWLQKEVQQVRRVLSTQTRRADGEPETGRDLLAGQRRPAKTIVDGLLNEGMVLFGGKPKRGKSWLMLDLALSVGTGSPVWRHFSVPEPQPVLYISLEDGRDDVRERLLAIQPGATDTGMLEFLYDFPRLNEGGLEKLHGYAESSRYRLIIIDVLARIEPPGKAGSDKTYHNIYDMLAPLQKIRQRHPFTIILVTHLRKAEAHDVFDGLHGSVAYQGAQDALWVLERPLKSASGVMHILGRRGPQQGLHLSFTGEHWEFVGHDEEVRYSQERQLVRELLQETDHRGLSIADVLKGLSQPHERYKSVKQLMYRMVKEGDSVRVARGRYGAAQQAWQQDMDLNESNSGAIGK